MELFALFIMIAALVAALERQHRHTFGLPRAPFGADFSNDRDLARLNDDLAVCR